MPTDEQLQRKIAEVLGLCTCKCAQDNGHGICCICDKPWPALEDWATDRNTSILLPVEDENEFRRALWHICQELYPENSTDTRTSAYIESLAWLLYKGWQWEMCKECEGKKEVKVRSIMGPGGINTFVCQSCSGKGGEWVKG